MNDKTDEANSPPDVLPDDYQAHIDKQDNLLAKCAKLDVKLKKINEWLRARVFKRGVF